MKYTTASPRSAPKLYIEVTKTAGMTFVDSTRQETLLFRRDKFPGRVRTAQVLEHAGSRLVRVYREVLVRRLMLGIALRCFV
jgi:hypothetical protein